MQNFTFSLGTTVHFGKGQISHLSELSESGKKVLIVYGGGSIKRSGLYDTAVSILKDAGLEIFELPGVEPNPRIETVRKGAQMCKDNGIDMVLAIGGGSVIDCAKIVAAGACYDKDPWDLVVTYGLMEKALPIYSVLTLSATGSETDMFAVISDLTKNEKWGTASPAILPKMSILDPEYTYSVSPKQTAAGSADIMSHAFENYFNNHNDAFLQKSFAESVLKTVVKYAPVAFEDPTNYEARANLMWSASFAINGLLDSGASISWCVHPIEHELSAFYDITHGQGLAIVTPRWMRFVMAKDPSKVSDFAQYGRNVWGLSGSDALVAEQAVKKTEELFFTTLKMPATLREVGINETVHFPVMAQKAAGGCQGCYVPLTEDDIVSILNACF